MAPLLTNFNDRVSPVTIQNFVRKLVYPQFELSEFLPDETISTNTFRYDTTQLGQEPAVRYRSWDSETPIGDRQGVTRASQELPPLGKKKIMTEEQEIKRQALATDDWSQYDAQVYNDLENLTEGVQARWEIDRGALLGSGSLTVIGSNSSFSQTITYPVPGGNIVTASPLWSSLSTADPLTDLNSWVVTYKAANRGVVPGVILISQSIAGYLVRNTALRTALYPTGGPTVVSQEQINGLFAAHGLPQFRIINSQATKADGTFDYVLPQNKVIMLPSAGIPVGKTVKGVTGSALQLVQSGTITLKEAPGIVGLTWEENDPARRYNMIDGCGMPVLANASMLFIATVA